MLTINTGGLNTSTVNAGTLRVINSAGTGQVNLGTGSVTLNGNSSSIGATNTSGSILTFELSGVSNNDQVLAVSSGANLVLNTYNFKHGSGFNSTVGGVTSFDPHGLVAGSLSETGSHTLSSIASSFNNGLTIPSGLLASNYSASQNAKPDGYRLTLGNYLPTSIYTNPPISLASQLSLNQNATAIYGPRPLGGVSNSPISISVVPEPTTFALAALGLGALAASRILRRMQKRNFASR